VLFIISDELQNLLLTKLNNIEQGQKNLERRQQNIEIRLDNLDKRQQNFEAGQKSLARKLDIVSSSIQRSRAFNNTCRFTSFISAALPRFYAFPSGC